MMSKKIGWLSCFSFPINNRLKYFCPSKTRHPANTYNVHTGPNGSIIQEKGGLEVPNASINLHEVWGNRL